MNRIDANRHAGVAYHLQEDGMALNAGRRRIRAIGARVLAVANACHDAGLRLRRLVRQGGPAVAGHDDMQPLVDAPPQR